MIELVKEPAQPERSVLKEAAVTVGKSLGGFAVGAAAGYAMAKGIEQIIPADGDTDATFESASMLVSGLLGTLIATKP